MRCGLNSMFGSQPCGPRNHLSGTACGFPVSSKTQNITSNYNLFRITCTRIERDLLYRYWWNTRIFPFTEKSYLYRAQWRYYFYLSHVRILVSPWLLTWLANYQRAFPLKRAAGSLGISFCYKIFLFFIKILTFWNRNCLYFSFVTSYPSFITLLGQAFCGRWPL